ncbi:MAG: glycosyltransferase [Hyphomonadaceae bacterium]|nr:glycosyltransferase [Hyphomonadaceae bacterium]
MTTLPAVSVIMPAYNARTTLAASVKSVQDQTLQNWELIIIDDGSTDDTAALAMALAKADPRICVIQCPNRGPSVARNKGADLAKAMVLAFLDADDLWAPDRLSGMLKAFRDRPDTGILFSRTRFVDAQTLQPGTLTAHRARLSAADLMAENALCSTSNIVCLKTVFEATKGFTPGLNHAEDQDWLLRVALDGQWQIEGLDEEWFFYRSSEQSQSADLNAMRDGWLQMVGKACREFPDTAPAAARRAYGPIHRQLARRALRMAQPRLAFHYLFLGLRHDPLMLARQPRRTCLTLAGTLLSFVPNQSLKELVAR